MRAAFLVSFPCSFRPPAHTLHLCTSAPSFTPLRRSLAAGMDAEAKRAEAKRAADMLRSGMYVPPAVVEAETPDVERAAEEGHALYASLFA
mgnify:FL=1